MLEGSSFFCMCKVRGGVTFCSEQLMLFSRRKKQLNFGIYIYNLRA